MSRGIRLGITAIMALSLAGTGAIAVADEDLERRIQRLENILDGDQLVEIIDQLSAVERQMRELRGEIEEQSHRLNRLEQRQRNLYGDLDERMRQLELEVDRSATAAATPETVEQAAEAPATGGEQSEREAYQAAFNTLREGRYGAAASAFNEFLDQWGDGDFAANARYWLGEAHYVSRDFDLALDNFERVLADFPDSNKAPDALLKIGYTQYELGEHDAARETLEQVKNEYAGSSVARLAEDRLVRMSEEGY